MNRRLGRRTFAKGLGAAITMLPWLEALQPARAQEQAPIQRLVLMFNPNGTVQSQFWPTVIRSESDFDLSPILAPLEAHKARLLLLKGLSISVAKVGPGGPHQKGTGGLFTGRELQAGKFLDGCGAAAGWANGASIDQTIADVIGQNTLLPSLELGIRATQAEVRSRVIYEGPGAPLPPEDDPTLVYQRLFSGLQMAPDELTRLRAQRLSVLDVVKGQFAEIEMSLGSADKARLEQHAEMVRGVERRLDLITGVSGQCSIPAAPPALAPDDENTMAQISQLQTDLMATAFACDLTRVGSLQYSTAINAIRFPWLNSLGDGHTLSHAPDSDMDASAQLTLRANWHAAQLAHFMDTLAAIPEGNGSVLDHTLIVWGNELGVGNLHGHDDIPFVVAGGGVGWRMGRMLQYEALPHNRLLVSLQNAFGIPSTSYGYTDYAEGALDNLV
jgi:hypothetical protein